MLYDVGERVDVTQGITTDTLGSVHAMRLLPAMTCLAGCAEPASAIRDADFVQARVDRDTLGDLDYAIETWVDVSGRAGADGAAPELLIVRPQAVREATGLLLYLHGNTGIDDEEDPALCDTNEAIEARDRFVYGWEAAARLIAERGASLVAPTNLWCDAWLGEGEADPVDTSHLGFAFLEAATEWAMAGGAGFDVQGPLVAWGSSLGGVGAALAAARLHGFEAVLVDSAPLDFSYQGQPAFSRTLHHVLGGGLRELPERYRAASPVALVEDGALEIPLMLVDNIRDEITHAAHGRAMRDALRAQYAAAGTRWADADLNHAAPGDSHHVQAGLRQTPALYVTARGLDFLFDGRRQLWAEAEAICTGCVVDAESGWAIAASAGAAARLEGEASLAFTPGAAVEFEASLIGVAALGLPAAALADDVVVARLRWTRGGDELAVESVYAGDLTDGEDVRTIGAHLAATQLALPGPALGGETFEVLAGDATVLADGVYVSW